MSKNFISASIVAIILLLWLGSGIFSGDSAPQEHDSLSARGSQSTATAVVELKLPVPDYKDMSKDRKKLKIKKSKQKPKKTAANKAREPRINSE